MSAASVFLTAGALQWHAQVRRLALPGDPIHLRISSRHAGSRDPSERVQFELTLSEAEHAALVAALESAPPAEPEACAVAQARRETVDRLNLAPSTAIGRGFTRLLPAIQYDAAMIGPPDSSADCVLGKPPKRLRAVHWPALVNACVARAEAAIAEPVEIEVDGGCRRFNVLGSLVVERNAQSIYSSHAWQVGEPPRLQELRFFHALAEEIPQGAGWVHAHGQGLWKLMREQWPRRRITSDYVIWVQDALKQRFWSPGIQAQVRARIAEALQMDPVTLRKARRRYAAAEDSRLLLCHYNQMHWWQLKRPQLRTEARQWLPLLQLVWSQLYTVGEPLRQLQAMLASQGIRPAFWRLLHQEGTGWMVPFLKHYALQERRNGRAAIDLLQLAQAFGTQSLVPMWMLREVLNENGNPNRPRRSYAEYWTRPAHAPFLARLGQWHRDLVAQGHEAGLARLREGLHVMLQWDEAHPKYAGSRAMGQVTLTGYLRRARIWAKEQALRAQGEAPWEVRFDVSDIECHGLKAVVLDSAWALWQEGQAMRHCASAFTERCQAKEYLMLSVRRVDTDARVATIGFKLGDAGPVLDQMAGVSNALVSGEVRCLAEACAQKMWRQFKPAPDVK